MIESVNSTRSNNILIMPSLLSAPSERLGAAIRELEEAGVTLFHYDVMDGHFVPNLSGSPQIIKDLQPHMRSPFDVHLMVDDPAKVIPWFNLPSVRSISIHVEILQNLEFDFEIIRSFGKKPGIVINPPTPNESLDPYFEMVDQVLVMSVYPGLGGQSLIPETLKKLEYCASRRDELGADFVLQVDGGVNHKTIQSVYDAGATEIVAGSAVFQKPSYAESYRNLCRCIGG